MPASSARNATKRASAPGSEEAAACPCSSAAADVVGADSAPAASVRTGAGRSGSWPSTVGSIHAASLPSL
jgi:hypothetical protein